MWKLIVKICISPLYHHQIGNMIQWPFFRVRSWKNITYCIPCNVLMTWTPFWYKMQYHQYNDSHCTGKVVLWPSYLYDGISYLERWSLYWNSPLELITDYCTYSYKNEYLPISHSHDDNMTWKCFPNYWLIVRDSPHTGPVMWTLMFSLLLNWISNWTNSRVTGDLRCHEADMMSF